jgi:hypothetical protein
LNSPAKDIASILNGVSSLALTLSTDLFHARMPEGATFQNVVGVFDNGGGGPLLAMERTYSDYYYPSVSVRVRNTDYDTGYVQAFDIMNYLHGQSGIVESGTLYTLIRAENDPQLLGYDENDRPVFVINFEVQRRTN